MIHFKTEAVWFERLKVDKYSRYKFISSPTSDYRAIFAPGKRDMVPFGVDFDRVETIINYKRLYTEK